jgi:hypothetical protein
MAQITKNTMVGMSLATMLTFVGSIYMASGFIQSKIGMIEANASGISYNSQKRVQDIIRTLQRDLRELESELRSDPDNEYIQRDISATEDDIDYYKDILECLRDDGDDCE